MRATAYVVLAVLLAAALAGASAASTREAAKTTCVAGKSYGHGLSAMYLASGRPRSVVRTLCAAVRLAGFRGGFQASATELVCGARMKGHPVIAGMYASPRAARAVRSNCAGLFPRSSWRRFE